MRDAYLDNAKGLLMGLVLFGHLVWPLPNSPANQAAYCLVYHFHMPCFALVSGYLSRPWEDRQGLAKLLKTLLAPYLVFVLLQNGILALYGKPLSLLSGLYGLWYLISLFWWRLVLPWLNRLPDAPGFILILVLALAAGYAPFLGLPLSGSRTLTMLPYFYAGYLLKRQGRDLRLLASRPLALTTLATFAVIAWIVFRQGNIHALLWSAYPYADIGLSPLWGPVARLLRITAGLAMCAAFLSLVPAKQSLLTRVGRRSLHVYLLHGLLLAVYREHPAIYEVMQQPPALLMASGAAALAVILSSPTIIRLTNRLVRPFG